MHDVDRKPPQRTIADPVLLTQLQQHGGAVSSPPKREAVAFGFLSLQVHLARMMIGIGDRKHSSVPAALAVPSSPPMNMALEISHDDLSFGDESSVSPDSSSDTLNVDGLNLKLEMLRQEKEEAERALHTISKLHQDKTHQIQKVTSRIKDEADTSYATMKDLLIQEHEASAVLEKRIGVLKKKRQYSAVTATAIVSLLVLLLSIVLGVVVDWHKPLAVLCAPAKPGTRIVAAVPEEEEGTSRQVWGAPYWAPPSLKQALFERICVDRPRVDLILQGRTLTIHQWGPSTTTRGDSFATPQLLSTQRESMDSATIDSDHMILVTKQGGLKGIAAPWIGSISARGNGLGEFFRKIKKRMDRSGKAP